MLKFLGGHGPLAPTKEAPDFVLFTQYRTERSSDIIGDLKRKKIEYLYLSKLKSISFVYFIVLSVLGMSLNKWYKFLENINLF